jgi:hypothetical protein
MNASGNFIDYNKIVTGLAAILPSSSVPDYVSMKNYAHLTVIINVHNVTTVTGSAITLKQATTVAAGGEKALAFTKMWANLDVVAGEDFTEVAVVSNTFTTDATNSKDLLYVIEVPASTLDIAGGFDCVRAGTANAVAATVNVLYILSRGKFIAGPNHAPSITD